MMGLLLFTVVLLIGSTLAHFPSGNNPYSRSFVKGYRRGEFDDAVEDRMADTNPFMARKLAAYKAGYKVSDTFENAKEDVRPSWSGKRYNDDTYDYRGRYRLGDRY